MIPLADARLLAIEEPSSRWGSLMGKGGCCVRDERAESFSDIRIGEEACGGCLRDKSWGFGGPAVGVSCWAVDRGRNLSKSANC